MEHNASRLSRYHKTDEIDQNIIAEDGRFILTLEAIIRAGAPHLLPDGPISAGEGRPAENVPVIKGRLTARAVN